MTFYALYGFLFSTVTEDELVTRTATPAFGHPSRGELEQCLTSLYYLILILSLLKHRSMVQKT
jgi:hypothetical protein